MALYPGGKSGGSGNVQAVTMGYQQWLPKTFDNIRPGDIITVYYNGSAVSPWTGAEQIDVYNDYANHIMISAKATATSATLGGSGSVNMFYSVVRPN